MGSSFLLVPQFLLRAHLSAGESNGLLDTGTFEHSLSSLRMKEPQTLSCSQSELDCRVY